MNDQGRRLLPPMAMLHSFAAAARHGSFSRAADEVGLTQSAISRQIANLEELIDMPLFDRVGRGVTLNARGRRYADEIAPALARIRRATSTAMAPPEEKVIELATLPSFGMRWLAPRLPRLTERHPDLVVNFAARSDEFDFAVEPYDGAIHFGQADWPHAAHDLLFHERVVPVASPALLAASPVTRPEHFLRLPLLVQSVRRDAWSRWFKRAGVPYSPGAPLPSFAHFLMLAQAATAGAGAALIPSFLIEPELRSGQLVSPIDLPLDDDRAYYFVCPEDRAQEPTLLALRTWMLDEAAMATG